jgi:hypothetical protein
MNERESDPTGAFHGGGEAGLADKPHRQPHARDAASGVDETEREVITSGTAATSEVADRDAQEDAEGQGDGPPLPR